MKEVIAEPKLWQLRLLKKSIDGTGATTNEIPASEKARDHPLCGALKAPPPKWTLDKLGHSSAHDSTVGMIAIWNTEKMGLSIARPHP